MNGKKGMVVLAAVAGLLAGAAAGCSSTDSPKPAKGTAGAQSSDKAASDKAGCGRNSCG